MATAKKLKSKAQTSVPQTRDEVAKDIARIGELMRKRTRGEADMNDKISQITKDYQPELDMLTQEIEGIQQGVQAYCEAHRDELTDSGKTKTANFVTGEIQWRANPPSVRVSKADQVIEFLKRIGLGRFVRTKEEINKDAILSEPDAIKGVQGITIVSGVEQFVINPFEQEAA